MCIYLVSFSATECLLSGPLPSELGLLTNLRKYRVPAYRTFAVVECCCCGFGPHCFFFGTVGKFWASRNALTGTIPAEIGNATELEILELYDNAITGAMPNPICNLVPSAEMGGNLTLLVVDCEVNCTCCTNCQ